MMNDRYVDIAVIIVIGLIVLGAITGNVMLVIYGKEASTALFAIAITALGVLSPSAINRNNPASVAAASLMSLASKKPDTAVAAEQTDTQDPAK